MSLSIVRGQLAADVAAAGTITVSYPTGKNRGNFYLAMGHTLVLGGGDIKNFPNDFDVTLNSANITITNSGAATWAAGTDFVLQLEEKGQRAYRAPNSRELLASTTLASLLLISLGAPIAPAAGSVAAAQARAAAGDLTINGTRAANGVATLDVPRSLTMVSTGAGDTTQTVTAYGTDVYGRAMAERKTLNGTTAVVFTKAFKTVTRVAVSAACAGNVSMGHTDVLGLPVFLPAAGYIVKELLDGATATAGTTVAGIRTAGGSTLLTGDVRGTYDPNSVCDGTRVFELLVAVPDGQFIGIDQFAG
jgi:hypothetical protein